MLPAPTTGGPACTTIYFDGTAATDVDAVAPENINAAGEGFTLSAWVLRAITAGHARPWEVIIDFGNGMDQDNLYVAFDCGEESQMCYYRHSGDENDGFAGWNGWAAVLIPSYQPPFPPNQWMSVQVTHTSNGNVSIYWDGVEQATANFPPPVAVERSGLYVGHSHWPGRRFQGQMQDLFVFNAALSPE